MVLKNDDEININDWVSFLQKNSNANTFQTLEYYLSQKNNTKQHPFLFGVYDKNNLVGIVSGFVIRNGIGIISKLTSRAIIIGGPLLASDINNKDTILDFLLKGIKINFKNKVVYIEFRNIWDMSNYRHIFINNGFEYEDHLDILINLKKSEQELWNAMTRDRKKSIKKGQKELEIKLISENNEYQIDSVYSLLRLVYKRIGLPLPHKDFFLNVIKSLYPKGYIKIFGAYKDSVLIGVRLVFCYNGLIYDWYAGANDDFLEYRPNDILIWSILKWGHDNGYKQFDFGGAGKPNVPYGVRDYKLKFGGILVNYGRFEYVNKPVIMFLGKTLIKLKDGVLKLSKGYKKKFCR